MPRAQNAHAYVNAAFLLTFNDDIIQSASICFGGINPVFIHAKNTEKSLQGKNLYTNETLQSAISYLNSELLPDWVLPDASPEYRKNLAISLFYKFVLNTAPEGKVKAENKSGGEILHRPLSSGTQVFDEYKDKFPLTQPVPKYEGLIQVSGEAQYSNDIPKLDKELWAAFVHATKVRAKIGKIDASDALVKAMRLSWLFGLTKLFEHYRKFQEFATFSRPRTFPAKTISVHSASKESLRWKKFSSEKIVQSFLTANQPV